MKTTLISILLFSFSISVTAQTAEYTEKDSNYVFTTNYSSIFYKQ